MVLYEGLGIDELLHFVEQGEQFFLYLQEVGFVGSVGAFVLAADGVSTLDDALGEVFGQISVDPVVYGGGGDLEVPCYRGHRMGRVLDEFVKNLFSVGAVVSTVVFGGFADSGHCVISFIALLNMENVVDQEKESS